MDVFLTGLTSPFLLGVSMVWLHPLWMVGVGVAGVVAVLAGLYFLLQRILPKVAAIAWTTSKEGLSQPLFYVLVGASASSPCCCSRSFRTTPSAKTSRCSRTRA